MESPQNLPPRPVDAAARAFAAYLTEQARSPLADAATRRDLAVHAAFWRHVAERGG